MTSRTILDLDLRKILSKIEKAYGIKLPRSVLAVDYGERNDLYITFRHVAKRLGVPTEDGLLIFFYDNHGDGARAGDILDLSLLMHEYVEGDTRKSPRPS